MDISLRDKVSVWSVPGPVVDRRRSVRGYRVQILIAPAFSDEMYESISHFALFSAKEDAEALVIAIRKAGMVNLAHWTWSPSAACPIAALQVPPIVRPEREARPKGAPLAQAERSVPAPVVFG